MVNLVCSWFFDSWLQEHQTLNDQYIQYSQGFIVVYDITDDQSFDKVKDFVQQILRVKNCSKIPLVLVGNKCDLENERVVNREIVQMYANYELWCVPTFESSAKLRIGIDDCFETLVTEIKNSRIIKNRNLKKRCCKIL